MKTIVEGISNVKKILGKQRLKDTEYRMLYYLLQTECEDGLLLHNTITGQLVLLDEDEAQTLKMLPAKRDGSMNQLIEDYFLVPLNYNEDETVKIVRKLLKKVNFHKGITGYTILPTTNCNARCFYCYESNYEHINMTEETAHRVAEFINANHMNLPVHISWFGGEPLVGLQRINQICAELKDKSIPFSSSMISNGYLFNETVVKEAVADWNLKNVQITIDGTEEIYNRTKAYVSVKGSPYKRVLQNIELLLENKIHVNVRLNLDQHNETDLKNLIDYLQSRFKKYENFDMYVHVLYENNGFAPIRRTKEIQENLFKLRSELNWDIMKEGRGKYYSKLPSIRIHSCMADSENAMVIYPDGRLYKCEHVAPGDDFGDIIHGVMERKNIDKFIIGSNLSMCKTCPLRPSCYILQECEGLKDRNKISCRFEIDSKISALEKNYRHFKKLHENVLEKHNDQTLDKCDI